MPIRIKHRGSAGSGQELKRRYNTKAAHIIEGESPARLYIAYHGDIDNSPTWASMPAAETLLYATWRHGRAVAAEVYSQVRLNVVMGATPGYAGSKLILKYATSWATVLGSYSQIGTSPVEAAISSASAASTSGWVPLVAGAIADPIYIMISGIGGNGTVSPVFANIGVEFK